MERASGAIGAAESQFRGWALASRYWIRRELGRGGMATVYLARDQKLARDVVVKFPHARFLAEKGALERFRREILNLTNVDHPHILKVLDAGSVDSTAAEYARTVEELDSPGIEVIPYAVFQYLEGGSLEDRFAKPGRLLGAQADLGWLEDVAGALDYIHQRDMIHRDVKPGNILFDAQGHAYLADFGIAKALGKWSTGLTDVGTVPGTPEYMAPEMAELDGKLGPAYDQYALATVAYEALAGRLPFDRGTPIQILTRKQTDPPKPISEVTSHVPAPAAQAVMGALARDPASRFPSCLEFFTAFQGRRDAPPPAAWSPRARVAVAALVLLSIGLAAAAAYFALWGYPVGSSGPYGLCLGFVFRRHNPLRMVA